MAQNLKFRLTVASFVLATGLAAATIAAQLGVVHVGAGEMKIVMGKGEEGLTMDISARTCPPNCGIDIGWRPLVR